MKCLVLSSGGLDSTVAVALAIDRYGYENVSSLSIFYGQKHDKEINAARAIASYYNIKHYELDLTEIFKYSNCSLLKQSTEKIPTESYKEQLEKNDVVSTYVPFRNGLFLSSAASYALSLGCDLIYYGAHMDDAAGNAYPDCSPEFSKSMAEAIYFGSGFKVKLESPFVHMRKADIVKLGSLLKVPFEKTWSCYNGNECACGKCGTCIDRLKAFEINGLKDPIKYEE